MPCALGVGGRDNRRMEVEEAFLMEERVNGHSHVVADAEYGAEGVGAGAQVSDLPQEFDPMHLRRTLSSNRLKRPFRTKITTGMASISKALSLTS